ncbi:MAG TPA: hypothetical protein VMN39_10150 [Longimicrobiaceae bacterium]|nr:hypothetical protein [Longimicrobiaceae bacterium]
MRFHRSRRLSVLVTPNGIHLVDYRSGTRGWQIQGYASESLAFETADEAVAALANMVEAYGGRGGRVSVAISGLGTCHHILTLPPADRALLHPIVERELRRFYPAVFDADANPLVDLVPMGDPVVTPGEPREWLATAVPRQLVSGLVSRFDARGVVIDHLTILPRVLERIFETFSHSEEPSAVLLLIPEGPLLGFFFEGRLRLYSEPAVRDLEPSVALRSIGDYIDRGALFLRQQFPEARVARVLVAGPAVAVAELQKRVDLPVERFQVYGDSPGALVALGAALDGDDEGGFNLLPVALRPPTEAQRWIRVAMAVAAALVIVAGSWWAAYAIDAESRAEATARHYDFRVASTQNQLSGIVMALQEREAHAARVQVADSLLAGRGELLDILWTLEEAQPTIQMQDLALTYAGDGWSGTLRGRARTATAGGASRSVEQLLIELRRTLTSTTLDLAAYGLADPEPEDELMAPGAPVAVDFEISFIVGEPESN